MASLVGSRSASRLLSAACRPRKSLRSLEHLPTQRSLFNFFRKPTKPSTEPKVEQPILSQDDLFHPFSKSPFPQVRARGEAIKQLAPCPVCASTHSHLHAHTKAQPRAVNFECPDCGWPTHCTEEHWKEDEEHKKYCSRLREVNEDEHDLRSGRKIWEFELPGTLINLLKLFLRFLTRLQALRDTRKPYPLRTGMCFGTLEGSLPWTRNVPGDTPVNFLPIQSPSAVLFINIVLLC